MIIRNFYRDLSIATDCPAMAVCWAIEAIAEHKYLANRHHWTADRDTVVKNLKSDLYEYLDQFGPLYILEQFDERFIS